MGKTKFLCSTLGLILSAFVAGADQKLPRPDGQPADMSKPVQVYILMGQSNMLGFGKVAKLKEIAPNKYPYLIDDEGNWTERKDVRNVRVMSSGVGNVGVHNNEWMSIKGRKIGPEIGIGHHLGHFTDAPVLILKSCIGNRSLGWDLLPPGSKQYEYEGQIQPGYGEVAGGIPKEQAPDKKWYAGMQYDGDVANAKKVLSELGKYYPGAEKYEVAGFFWWQGDKDRYNAAHADRYEQNLVQLIKQLRVDFNSPKANFVCATLGQTKRGASGNEGKIINAMFAVDGAEGKYQEFKNNVSTVYTNPMSHGGTSNVHYSGNPETYMDVGEAMGKAMVELLKMKQPDQKEVSRVIKLSPEQQSKLPALVRATLVKMSNEGELRPMRVNISKTKARVWLAEASANDTVTFQLINGDKQVTFKFDELTPEDHVVLARLVAALKPQNAEAQALAGLYVNAFGSKVLAEKYFEKSSGEATEEVIKLLSQ